MYPLPLAGTYPGLMVRGASVSVLKGGLSGSPIVAHLVGYVDAAVVAASGQRPDHVGIGSRGKRCEKRLGDATVTSGAVGIDGCNAGRDGKQRVR